MSAMSGRGHFWVPHTLTVLVPHQKYKRELLCYKCKVVRTQEISGAGSVLSDDGAELPACGVMTREEAISLILSAWYRADGTVTSREEVHDSERQLRDCLHALGVTDAEINRAI